MRIKPTQDYILVKRKEQKTKTTSGLIIPEQKVAKYDVLEGTVVEVGPGRITPDGNKIIEIELKKGDKILYKQYAGHHLIVDDEDYWLINERDVIAVIE